jgi:uncharacterized protein
MLSSLDQETKTLLLNTAREAIRAQLVGNAFELPPLVSPPEASGVFVTVHVSGTLRGCIGFLEMRDDLLSTVAEAARRAAASDPRFRSVEEDEFTDMDIQVTLLGPLEDCPSPEDFEIGIHGLVIDYHGHRGLLLPQVAVERGWDKSEFLSALCLKAQLPDRSWESPETELFRFEGLVLCEKDERTRQAVASHDTAERSIEMKAMRIRQPAVSGLFYPADPTLLSLTVDRLLDDQPAACELAGRPLAIVSPHAGLRLLRSDRRRCIRGASWHPVPHGSDRLPQPSRVFQRHIRLRRRRLPHAARSDQRRRRTPREATRAQRCHRTSSPLGHRDEHAVEVQLPFIQRINPEAKVLPIVMGDQRGEYCLILARALARHSHPRLRAHREQRPLTFPRPGTRSRSRQNHRGSTLPRCSRCGCSTI